MRALAALAAFALGLSAAWGQSAEPVRPDSFETRASQLYAGDPMADIKLRVEEIFGIFLVDPPRRHASEVVELSGDQVVVRYWQPSGGFTDAELQTRAVQWSLLGRTQFSAGARAVFSEMPGTREIVLVFHDVFRKDQKGRRMGEESVVPYLKIRLTQDRFDRLKLKPVEQCVERSDCSSVFRVAFDEARFDRKGIKVR